MKSNYICKIASLYEMNAKWDYEINHNSDNQYNWIIWKQKNLTRYQKGDIIPYYGILDGIIICEATAMINSDVVQNSEGLVGHNTAYLSAFRTINEFQNKGYFSKLMKFMLNDLKNRGFTKVTLGVEPNEEQNIKIYKHYGFTEYIKSATETYPDGTVINVEYYAKNI